MVKISIHEAGLKATRAAYDGVKFNAATVAAEFGGEVSTGSECRFRNADAILSIPRKHFAALSERLTSDPRVYSWNVVDVS